MAGGGAGHRALEATPGAKRPVLLSIFVMIFFIENKQTNGVMDAGERCAAALFHFLVYVVSAGATMRWGRVPGLNTTGRHFVQFCFGFKIRTSYQ